MEADIYTLLGRAIAQAVSRRLPTAAARVRARVRLCGICGGQSGTGAGLLRVLRFPLPIGIPPIAPQSSSIIWGWYSIPDSGRSTTWTQFTPCQNNVHIYIYIHTYILVHTLLTQAFQWFSNPINTFPEESESMRFSISCVGSFLQIKYSV
jgi:hypothetical protein